MVLNDLLRPIAHEATVIAFQKEKRIRRQYGEAFVATIPPPIPITNGRSNSKAAQKKSEIIGRPKYVKLPGKDIYGNEKSTDTKYFKCSNCDRNIAGTRFAAHIVRCLSGRNFRSKSTKNYSSSGYNSPSVSPPSEGRSSPAKRKLPADDNQQKSQVTEFFDRINKHHKSVPVSRSSSPPTAQRSMSETPKHINGSSAPPKKKLPSLS